MKLSKLINQLIQVEKMVGGDVDVMLGSNQQSDIHLNFNIQDRILYLDDDM